ncbi:MAG: FAD-dependent oxidoreductase [Bryobacteraceae bacterium]
MAALIGKRDPRYDTLKKSRNLRWPALPNDVADSIELCESSEEVLAALQRVVDAGRRPTIRSGGHCYEDFVVNNPGGSILDLSVLTSSHLPGDGSRYRISAGKVLGDVYLDLFKRHGVTIPAGTCYTVGAGGHIAGGGYGLLSRLHGLTVDWVSAVDIVTIDPRGKAVARRLDKRQEPDLFRACRGAGGGNFGVITGYLFDTLPTPPQEVISGGVSFQWAGMTEQRFVDILLTYGDYWATRGKDRETWGLFSVLNLQHSDAGRFGLSLQFCNPDGTCRDLSVVNEFLDRFEPCNPSPEHSVIRGDQVIPQQTLAGKSCPGQHALTRRLWLDATVEGSGSSSSRAKYKSTYMKKNFSATEAKCVYTHLKRTFPKTDLRGSMLAVDSYGGAINRDELQAETAISQRSSVMKLQFMSFWKNSEDDAARLRWMGDFYKDLYSTDLVPSQYAGTPYPCKQYEGCYINYPDKDMLKYSFWPQLYYGDGDLYAFLQNVKQRYDPHNVFHHAMSVRPPQRQL